jgi:signal transduction histidine kinase
MVLGSIQLGSRKPRKFSASEIRLFETVGSQMGIAVQKARLLEETQRQLQSLKLLVAGARGLTAGLDVEALAKDILKTVANSFGFLLAWIGRAEPDGLMRPLRWAGDVGDYLSNVEIRWDDSPLGQGPSGHAIRARSPVVMDIAQDPAFAPWREAALAKGYRSIAAFPLIAGEKPFGVLILYSHEPDFFTQERVELIQSYSFIAAGALENARLLEETRASKSELERALGVKNQFLSVMSHELRTPLSVVGGHAAMIKDGMLGEINPQQQAALQKVVNQTAEQLNMINDIMQATQLESDSIVVERYPVNLSDFLDHLKSDYDFTFDKEGVTLVWDYPPEPVTVVTDAGKLTQILRNLINNAIKFTDKGAVTVSARIIAGSRQQAAGRKQQPAEMLPAASRQLPAGGRWVELRVADTGVGIPEDKLEAVFDKFYQVDSSETRLYGGVGLGLYIVKQFTELLGGQVEVESEAGKGSEFTVTIPVTEARPQQ